MAEGQPASRTRRWLAALAEVSGAAILLHMHSIFSQFHNPLGRLGRHVGPDLILLSGDEAKLFLGGLLLVTPAAILLADAFSRFVGARPRHLLARAAAHPRATALAFALLAALVVQFFSAAVLRHAPLTDDEQTYVFQARCLLEGSLTAPAPEPAQSFVHAFMVRTNDHRWTGIYWPGQPALIAIGMLLGLPHLFQILCAFGLVYLGARFVQDLFGDEAGVLSAALLATSPLLLFGAATLHNAVPAAFALAVGMRSAVLAWRHGRLRDHVFCAAGYGAALLFRPFDTAALALPACGLLLAAVLRAPAGGATRARRLVGLTLGAVTASLFVAGLMATNRAITGDLFVTAYGLWTQSHAPGTKLFGFGLAASGIEHTPALAFSKLTVTLARLNSWFFGWPVSLAPLFSPSSGKDATAFCAGSSGRSRYFLLLTSSMSPMRSTTSAASTTCRSWSWSPGSPRRSSSTGAPSWARSMRRWLSCRRGSRPRSS